MEEILFPGPLPVQSDWVAICKILQEHEFDAKVFLLRQRVLACRAQLGYAWDGFSSDFSWEGESEDAHRCAEKELLKWQSWLLEQWIEAFLPEVASTCSLKGGAPGADFKVADSSNEWLDLAESWIHNAEHQTALVTTSCVEDSAEDNVLLAAVGPFTSSVVAGRQPQDGVCDAQAPPLARTETSSGAGVSSSAACSSEIVLHALLRRYPGYQRAEYVAVGAVRRWLLQQEGVSDAVRKTSLLGVLTALVELHSEEEVTTVTVDGEHEWHCSRYGADALLQQVLEHVDWSSMSLRGLRLAVEDAMAKAMRPILEIGRASCRERV